MFRSMYTAASGMTAQQLNLDNIANNLANSSTAGFRRRRLQFQEFRFSSRRYASYRKFGRPGYWLWDARSVMASIAYIRIKLRVRCCLKRCATG